MRTVPMGYKLNTKTAQSSGPETIGQERLLFGLLGSGPVFRYFCITLENNEKIRTLPDRGNGFAEASGGEGGIRTHGGRKPTTVFETAPIDHSGTSPRFWGSSIGGGFTEARLYAQPPFPNEIRQPVGSLPDAEVTPLAARRCFTIRPFRHRLP
jgi:hypothetical protein